MDDEQTILDYARSHGLSRDYTSDPPRTVLTAQERYWPAPCDHDEPVHLPPLTSHGKFRDGDAWDMDMHSALFLREAVHPSSTDGDLDLDQILQASRHLKLELPILPTDADLDHTRWLVKSCSIRRIDLGAALKSQVPEILPDSSTYDWPLLDSRLSIRTQSRLASEKLLVNHEALAFLKSAIKPGIPSPDTLLNDAHISAFKIASPVLPLSPNPSTIFNQDQSPCLDLALTSSPVDPANESLRAVHDAIFFEPLDYAPAADSDALLIGTFDFEPSPCSDKRVKPEDLRMQVPLSPHTDHGSPFKKIKLSDLVAPDVVPSSSTGTISEDGQYKQFFEEMMDLSGPVIKKLENEQLLEADNTLRLAIPCIAEDEIIAPWDTTLTDLKRCLIHSSTEELVSTDLSWQHTAACLRALCWRPVPDVDPKRLITDNFDDGTAAAYMDRLSIDDVDGDSYSYKQAGLRVLDMDQDDDDELEPMPISFDVATDLSLLIHAKQRDAPSSPSPSAASQALIFTQRTTRSALDAFFSMHTGIAPILPSTKATSCSKNVAAPPATNSTVASSSSIQLPTDGRLAPNQIIVSTTLLPYRQLISKLKSLLRQTTFLERSFGEEEADILAAPGIGLVLTSIQNLKQRALPGQPAQVNSVAARLSTLSCRYSSLFLFVATGDVLDASDVAALNAVAAVHVRLFLVPNGAEVKADWAAYIISSLGKTRWKIRGDGDQLPGEALLRGAGLDGMSALAALETAGSLGALASYSMEDRSRLLTPIIGTRAVDKIDALLNSTWTR